MTSLADRLGWETLPGLLDDVAALRMADRGADDPAWDAHRAAGYPLAMLLANLVIEAQLRQVLAWWRVGRGIRVLDLGCGPGAMAILLAEAGARVWGLDRLPAMLAMASVMASRAGVRVALVHGDARDGGPFRPQSFDAVLIANIWNPAWLPGVRAVLSPGGRLLHLRTNVGHGVWVPDDPQLDVLMQSALVNEPGRWAPARETPLLDLQDAGCWTEVRARSFLAERVPDGDPVFAAFRRMTFGRFVGPRLRRALNDPDWQRVRQLWDPASPGEWARRPDSRWLQSLTALTATLTS